MPSKYVDEIRKLEQRLATCIAFKKDDIEKWWSNFNFLVAQSARGRERFDHPSYILILVIITLAKGSFNKFHMEWSLVQDSLFIDH